MKEYKQEPYTVPLWIYKAIQVLRPVERLTVSEWAAKHRTLSGGAIPGPWNNDITPYLVGLVGSEMCIRDRPPPWWFILLTTWRKRRAKLAWSL